MRRLVIIGAVLVLGVSIIQIIRILPILFISRNTDVVIESEHEQEYLRQQYPYRQ